MGAEKEINCLGMKCPRPIIEIAKAARTSEPGTVISVQADDLAFESDVKAWAGSTKAEIIDFQNKGEICLVKIKIP